MASLPADPSPSKSEVWKLSLLAVTGSLTAPRSTPGCNLELIPRCVVRKPRRIFLASHLLFLNPPRRSLWFIGVFPRSPQVVSGLQSFVSAVPAVNVLKPFLPARGCTFIFNTRNTRTHARILAAETSVHGPGRSLQLSPRPKTTPVLVSLPQPWTVLYKYRIRTCTFARSPDHQHHVIPRRISFSVSPRLSPREK